MLPIFKVLMAGLFGRSATLRYPAVGREPSTCARGRIGIDIGRCIFCGQCGRKCPADAIEVDRADKRWVIDHFRCIQCGCCVEVCPKQCLSMLNTRTPVAVLMEKEVVCAARVSADTADHTDG